MKRIIYLILFIIPLSFEAIAGTKGHINFDDLSTHYGEPKVEINLSAALIGIVGTMSMQSDPELADMLNKLEYVKVRIYNVNEKPKHAFNTVDHITKKLKKDSWTPIVSVNEPHEKVRVFAQATGDTIDGIVVMVVDADKEAVFINIVGDIDPSQISKVTRSLNIDIDTKTTP